MNRFLIGNNTLMNNEVDTLINELNKVEGITEIIINSPNDIFIEKSGNLIQIDTKLKKNEINNFCANIAKFNKKSLTTIFINIPTITLKYI